MKKRLFLFVLIISFIVSLGLSSPSITVTNPHSGSIWYNGQTYTITWNKVGQMDDHVKIRLLKNGAKVLDITNSTLNNGSYQWTVPNSVQSGNYVIRVKTLDNQVYDDSNIFTIANQPSPSGSLTVVKPAAGDCWEKNKTYLIQWNSSNITELVKVRLYQGSTRVLAISDSTDNDGSYSWTIPNSLSDGNYKIMIKTLSNQYSDMSDEFSIKSSCNSGGGSSTPFPGNMNFVAGLNLAELAVYMHGPGPRIREFEVIRATLEKNRVKSPVTVKLFQGNREVANLGTYAPTVRSGKVRFSTMPSVMNLNLTPRQRAMMEENPQGFKLIFFSGSTIVGQIPIKVVPDNNGIKRIPNAVSYNKLEATHGGKIYKCPDLAVVSLDVKILQKYSPTKAKIQITGVVKNIGGLDYGSVDGFHIRIDIVSSSPPVVNTLKSVFFKSLKKGKSIRVRKELIWDIKKTTGIRDSSKYIKVVIAPVDPIPRANPNPYDDECSWVNNSMEKSIEEINTMIRNF